MTAHGSHSSGQLEVYSHSLEDYEGATDQACKAGLCSLLLAWHGAIRSGVRMTCSVAPLMCTQAAHDQACEAGLCNISKGQDYSVSTSLEAELQQQGPKAARHWLETYLGEYKLLAAKLSVFAGSITPEGAYAIGAAADSSTATQVLTSMKVLSVVQEVRGIVYYQSFYEALHGSESGDGTKRMALCDGKPISWPKCQLTQ